MEALVQNFPVEWWGHQSDMRDVFSKTAVVCLPSYREGMPKALLEASAMARPFVTTDVPGCRDVAAGGCGVLVPPEDAEALAEAIKYLLQNPEEASAMALRARRRAELEFDVRHITGATLALYQTLLDRADG
jgi:glycosyltransferase involved in cell wall biosynthesis